MAVKTNNSSLFEMIRNSIFRMEWLEEAKRLWENEVYKREVLYWKQIGTLLLSAQCTQTCYPVVVGSLHS